MNDKIDLTKCSKCGGKCCRIYLSALDGGGRPGDTWFEEWVEDWNEEFKVCGADQAMNPLFDPLEVHMGDNEGMIEELKARGIDPDFCKYHGAEGCLLPREKRPKSCREYMCDKVPETNMEVTQ